MTRLLLAAAILISTVAGAQGVDPVLRFPVLDHVADQVFVGGAYYDTTVGCPRWYNGSVYTACAVDAAGMSSAISTATSGLATSASVTSAIGAAVAPLATAASVTAEATARASADTTLSAAIAALQANTQWVCVNATLTGLSIPLTGGLSSVVNVTVPNAPVGTACTVGGVNRIPAGARPDVVVSTAGTASVAFVGGGGLLSGVIAIANGTYRICCAL